MKKGINISYTREGGFVEIIARDSSHGKIIHLKFPMGDKKKNEEAFRLLKDKCGFVPEIPTQKDSDLSWLD